MRGFRVFVIIVVVASVVGLGAGPASSEVVAQASISAVQLTGKGTPVDVAVTVVCDQSLTIGGFAVNVRQTLGHKSAQGSARVFNQYPGVPCTGVSQVLHVNVASTTSAPFKQGRATVSAAVATFDPIAIVVYGTNVEPVAVRITK